MARLNEAEIAKNMDSVPGWEIADEGDVNVLSKNFKFANFADALSFTNRVGALAEKADHHPRLVTQWGSVDVAFWSHDSGGVVEADFIMARRVNAL